MSRHAAVEQPRVPAGQAGGGRFASTSCPRVYALLDTLRPADPEPEVVEPACPGVPASVASRCGGGARTVLPVTRCPHGSFQPWASRNCRGCRRRR